MTAIDERVPTATYRLQLNHRFTFRDAAALVDYLEALGISHVYASPIFAARPGSLHGYDVVDHTRLNPELGTEQDFQELAGRLKAHRMGLILDVVPNHMCILGGENLWWTDVLENGPSSPFARHFDIDWRPPKADLRDKVLLPLLGDQYGRVLERGEIQLQREGGAFLVVYFEHRFPVAPRTWTAVLSPALDRARQSLGEEHDDVLELASIITALGHLPLRSETDPRKVRERQREKEIVKRRLLTLLEQAPEVREAVDTSVVDLNGRPDEPHSFDALERLLADQAYRLSFWRVAADEINYRRFFDVNELAALRVEEAAVFAALHALPLREIAEGRVAGLRVDHVDGLFDPEDYLGRLPEGCFKVVEKILTGNERLEPSWPIHGTTGYEMLSRLGGLFVDPQASSPLQEVYASFIGERERFPDVVYECKKLILRDSMSSELTVLSRRLDRISEQHRFSRDFTLNSLMAALGEVVACFPAYRSYVRAHTLRPDDRRLIREAMRAARRRNPGISGSLFDFIASVLLLEHPAGLTEAEQEERYDFVLRFQQLTGPVMAKGLEDTAAYRYHPLSSLNEVGGEPDRFGLSLEAFHAFCQERQELMPHSLSATSTHDTKRDEDVRARIHVLSELPHEWGAALFRFADLNRELKPVVDEQSVPQANEEYLLYQTLVGTWPVGADTAGLPADYLERIQSYLRKAMREAKQHSSWINPDLDYEEGVLQFVATLIASEAGGPFRRELRTFLDPLLRPGLLNGVCQALLKITAPGIPDLYQGTELWELRLVDPDNRQDVDYEARRQRLAGLDREATSEQAELADRLLRDLPDGRLKLYVTSRGLRLRRERPRVFREGEHVALAATGATAPHVVSFARRLFESEVVVATGRFFTRLGDPPVGEAAWGEERLEGCLGGSYRDLLTGERLVTEGSRPGWPLARVFAHLPLALLCREDV